MKIRGAVISVTPVFVNGERCTEILGRAGAVRVRWFFPGLITQPTAVRIFRSIMWMNYGKWREKLDATQTPTT